VLPDITEEEAMQVARRALLALQKPVRIDDREVQVTASIGLRFGLRGQTGETLLRDADIAMYQAKALGKSNVQVFEPSMHHASQQRMEILSELSRAIERNELVLHYQPIVRLTDGAMVGAEALLRWEHSRNGMTYPASFISIAEDSGLIADLGKWTLGEAIRTLRDWLARLPNSTTFTIHVNISPSELRRPGLVEFVRDTLDQHGVPAARLALEIAETGLMTGDARGLESLVQLKKLGVSVQIDDFGTGYSSIAYLRELPVDAVKVDKSVIFGIDEEVDQRRFVHAVLQLIDSVGLRAIVEGVETEAQRSELLAVGAEFAQGYLFSKPMRESELVALLAGSVDTPPWISHRE
jgi:EAL domain-containing protein (putative c-di-GMP-specific phosphodiesterase class I)